MTDQKTPNPDSAVLSTAGLGDSSVFAAEWEAFCRADYEDYKTANTPPCIAFFWSGSAFFNSAERWGDDWRRHYKKVGEAWWNRRGFTVTNWPLRDPITVSPNVELTSRTTAAERTDDEH